MKNFTESNACLSKAHCVACRHDLKFRQQVGAPEDCPHGVTPDNADAWERYAKTHPLEYRGLRGCCDRADQA
jgi:hypothetical protein